MAFELRQHTAGKVEEQVARAVGAAKVTAPKNAPTRAAREMVEGILMEG